MRRSNRPSCSAVEVMNMLRHTRNVPASMLAAAALIVLFALPASGQGTDHARTGAQLSRAELQELLVRYEAAVNSPSSGPLRDQARIEAALIRQRLDEGDMRVGDRVLLQVQGHPLFSDTFPVVAGRVIEVPNIGGIPLEGVLRSELEDHLREHIGRFVRSPIIRARSLVRLEIMGAVGRPGFHAVPSDVLVSDAIMLAGGPAGSADMGRLRIHRGREVLWQGEPLRAAVLEGRTLDQLSVRAGDGIFVPQQQPRMAVFRDAVMVVTGVTSLIWVLMRIGVL
jgi:protein involved in polysaccharide export with SLBB domain